MSDKTLTLQKKFVQSLEARGYAYSRLKTKRKHLITFLASSTTPKKLFETAEVALVVVFFTAEAVFKVDSLTALAAFVVVFLTAVPVFTVPSLTAVAVL